MPNKYLESFETATKNYSNQTERPGYTRGLFTWLRHNTTSNPLVALLRDKLQQCENNDDAKKIIELHFNNKVTKFHNHSFATYLLDELLKRFSDEDWARYHPKPIIFFQGTVYRGTLVPPSIVFKNGFSDLNSSKDLDDYVSDCNGSVGVSTTKSFEMAQTYALPPMRTNQMEYSNIEPYGYIYKINCRSTSAIDLEETHKLRGNKIRVAFARDKAEVNVIGGIKPCDVMMVWKVYREKSIPVEIMTNDASYLANQEREPDQTVSQILVPHRDFIKPENAVQRSTCRR